METYPLSCDYGHFSPEIGPFVSLLVTIILTILSLLSLMFVILGRAKHPRIVGALAGFLNVIVVMTTAIATFKRTL
jgi:hypothetical protein